MTAAIKLQSLPLRRRMRDANARAVCSGSEGGEAEAMHCSSTVLLISVTAMSSRWLSRIEPETPLNKSENRMLPS